MNVAKTITKIVLMSMVMAVALSIIGCKKECKHEYSDTVVAPTCTEDGYTVHKCTKCGDSYHDTSMSKTAHTYGEQVIFPTCTEEGYTLHTCTACGDNYNDTTVAVSAHRFNGGDCVYCTFKQPTEAITPNTEWYSEGIAVFSVTTKEQLAGLAEIVNGGNSLADTMIYLDADIDLGYAPWTPIGNADYAFAGSFVGNGHTISDLNVSLEGSYAGLFGNVSGELSDFTIDNASIFVKGANSNIAIACGYTGNKITNVKVDGYIDAKDSTAVGGIIGYTKAVVSDCESDTDIVGVEKVGGIAGCAEVTTTVFDGLINRGEIKGGDYSGGIFGGVWGSGNVIYIDNSENYGNVTGKANVGGIAGYADGKVSSIIRSSTCQAEIAGEYYVGGIAGQAKNVAIADCSNEGSAVSASSCTLINEGYYAYLGGYVGCGYSIENCVNSSDITYLARGSYVGGIAGYLSNGINECTNSGNISGYDLVGGIAGYVVTPGNATVINLINTGNVSGKSKVGGIVGQWTYGNPITIGECSNSGEVKGTSYVGGIIAYLNYSASAVLSAYNLTDTGDVTGSDGYVGGLFAYVNGKDSSVVSNCTVTADITGFYLVGGLIGKADFVKLSDSSNDGSTVTATGFILEGEDTNVYLGGYVGLGYKVSGCTNTVDINYTSLGNYVGGIVGKATSELSDCTNNASINSKASKVGGIAGELYSNVTATYNALSNNGNVSGVSDIGGVAGSVYESLNQQGAVWLNTHNSYFTSTFTSFTNNGVVDGNDNVGGIVGKAYLVNNWYGSRTMCCNLLSCRLYGNLKAHIIDFENGGSVSGKTNVGEIIGSFNSDADSTLDNYTVTGSITINNELLEGTYDVGSNTNLTLTNRVGPKVEEETPQTEETPETPAE